MEEGHAARDDPNEDRQDQEENDHLKGARYKETEHVVSPFLIVDLCMAIRATAWFLGRKSQQAPIPVARKLFLDRERPPQVHAGLSRIPRVR